MASAKRRRICSMRLGGASAFVLLLIALCIYAFYFLSPEPLPPKPKTKRPSPSLPPKPTDYRPVCLQVSETIARVAKDLGGADRDFRILEKQTCQKAGKIWTYTRVEIRLPKGVDLEKSADRFRSAVKKFPQAACQWDKRLPTRGAVSVKLAGLSTHVLVLVRTAPRLAIIIDDFGEDLEMARAFLDLGVPLTLAILPDRPHSQACEKLAHDRGYEAMLHLPMEPEDSGAHNPGPGAILSGMDQKEIAAIVSEDIKKFRFVRGINNHMGSRITETEPTIRWVLEAVKPTGLYYIDSRTTPRSVAYTVARELNIPTARNEVFIDNQPEVSACERFLEKAIREAKAAGQTIALGHPRLATLQALRRLPKKLEAEGVELVFASELVR